MRILRISEQPFRTVPYYASGRGETITKTLPMYFAYVDKLPSGVDAIVATSDLQGREFDSSRNRLLGEAVVDLLLDMQEKGEIPSVSLLLSSGDLYDSVEMKKMGATGDVTSVLNAFATSFPSFVGVHGNHDMITKAEVKREVNIVDGSAIRTTGLRVGGVCGISGKPRKNQRKDHDDFIAHLKRVTDKSPDIILLHQSPLGDSEDQTGNLQTREHFESHGNALVISGHCHWEDHLALIGKNQVLNTDNKVFVLVNA